MSKKKHRGVPNIERVRAENERRRSNSAVPFTTTDKRMKTDERIIAAELRLEESPECPECGSKDCPGTYQKDDDYD